MVLSMLVLFSSVSDAAVTVYTNESLFTGSTAAESLQFPAPNATTTKFYPCLNNYDWGCDYALYVPMDGQKIKITAPKASSIWVGYRFPNLSPQNTNLAIVANGEDDYLIELPVAVRDIGFEFITNSYASETITLKDEFGYIIGVIKDDQLDTIAYQHEFVGFKSDTPVKSIYIDNTGGSSVNEALSRILVSGNRSGDGATAQCDAELAALQAEISELNNQINALQVENSQLRSQVGSLQDENLVLKNQVITLQADNATLKSQINALKAENAALKTQINQILNSVNASIDRVEAGLGINIPGASGTEQLNRLIDAILNLNPGRKQGIITQFQ